MTRARRLVLGLTVLVLGAPGLAAQPAPPAATRWIAEFPPYDVFVAWRLEAGLASKQADRLLREDPFAVETVQALVSAHREEDALRAARQAFDKRPELIARLLDAFSRSVPTAMGEVPGRTERVQAMLEHARARMPALERTERAAAADALVKAESSLLHGSTTSRDTYAARLQSVIDEYEGTDAALVTEVDLLDHSLLQSRADSVKRHDEMLAFARAHAGTTAGAKALYLVAFHVAQNPDMLNLAPRERVGDPTNRFLRVVDLVGELQDGRYPTCEWTKKGDSLITGFSTYKATFSPENIDRMLAACTAFAASHFALDDTYPDGNGIGYLVTTTIAEVYKIGGVGAAGVERLLTDLEAKAPDRFAVQYLRALFYLKTMNAEQPAARPALLDKARRTLAAIHAQADGLYRRKALATLASLAFYHRDYPAAREAFAAYVRAFPDSSYTWVAAIRIGQCFERTGDWPAALAAYQAVNATGETASVARVLADVFAGRAHEALGDPAKALAEFRRALERWDVAFGETYDVSGQQSSTTDALPLTPAGLNPDSKATRTAVEARVAQLQQTTAAPGAALLERARWLLKMKRWRESAEAAGRVVAEFPASSNVPDARYLGHRALLEEALERADVEKPDADLTAAMGILDRLSREPFDFAVCVANIARGYIASGSGSVPEGEKLLLATLARWRSRQESPRTLAPLEQDVAGIRAQVFRPDGDSVFAGTRWNGFAWLPSPSPFVVTAPEVTVKLADGKTTRLSFVQQFAHLDNALFFDQEQVELLNTLITRLGGTKARQGQIFLDRGYMEAPNQPVGPSLSVMAFLGKAFRVMPGHWGGWHFATFPAITELLFLDEARTRALVRVRVGYAGGDVLLEKRAGAWKATKLTQTWVE